MIFTIGRAVPKGAQKARLTRSSPIFKDILVATCMAGLVCGCQANQGGETLALELVADDTLIGWERPVDQPVFTIDYGNNHDPIFFYGPDKDYPYHLLISHEEDAAHLWRAKTFSWSSDNWELVSDRYVIDNFYEFDDGVKVGDTYYIYENGNVYTWSGDLADGNGNWLLAGHFPVENCDDIGVYYEDGIFHIFGESGVFSGGHDGAALSHYSSPTGLGDWKLVNQRSVDPNRDGRAVYGVGDATVIKSEGTYFLFSDIEWEGVPYRIAKWKTTSLSEPFQFSGLVINPRMNGSDDWDNDRIQDGEIEFIPSLNRFVMFANFRDLDGSPGGNFDSLPNNMTRVVGVLYSTGDTLD